MRGVRIVGLNEMLIRQLGGRHKGVCTAPHCVNTSYAVIPPDCIRAHNMVTRKTPEIPPGGLGVHAVQLLQLRPSHPMPSVPSSQYRNNGPWRLVIPTMRQRPLEPMHKMQPVPRTPPGTEK